MHNAANPYLLCFTPVSVCSFDKSFSSISAKVAQVPFRRGIENLLGWIIDPSDAHSHVIMIFDKVAGAQCCVVSHVGNRVLQTQLSIAILS